MVREERWFEKSDGSRRAMVREEISILTALVPACLDFNQSPEFRLKSPQPPRDLNVRIEATGEYVFPKACTLTTPARADDS
jgi:hypothetical protein